MQIASFNTLFIALYALLAVSLVCGQTEVKTPSTTTPGKTADPKPITPEQKAEGLKTASGVLSSVSAGGGGLAMPSGILKAIADGVGQMASGTGAPKTKHPVRPKPLEKQHVLTSFPEFSVSVARPYHLIRGSLRALQAAFDARRAAGSFGAENAGMEKMRMPDQDITSWASSSSKDLSPIMKVLFEALVMAVERPSPTLSYSSLRKARFPRLALQLVFAMACNLERLLRALAKAFPISVGDGSASPPPAPVNNAAPTTSPGAPESGGFNATDMAKKAMKAATGVMNAVSGGLTETMDAATNLIKKVSNYTSNATAQNTRRSITFDNTIHLDLD
ncbi:uncharacterized protein MELLADRAFT_86691 [Melampsora larici-populina 98AG31]|uniref:Secreted protein n=1 Tax=Melampsora larici-populina (strain 98AG31 / pathotype 3-4-7) TaxID=747676 RepID=F4R319_MELLP|nr:uncharacterized protein MELLADRAFT_86691 [Melampsora larici-populina 98AG31]EGG13247.1 hypothetical protein MELLADRAFT_86691 [Melampsora larici-populina 98AG31]